MSGFAVSFTNSPYKTRFHPDFPVIETFPDLKAITYLASKDDGEGVMNEGWCCFRWRTLGSCCVQSVKRDVKNAESKAVLLFTKALRYSYASGAFSEVSAQDLTSLSTDIRSGKALWSLYSKKKQQLITDVIDRLADIRRGNVEEKAGVQHIDRMIQQFYERKKGKLNLFLKETDDLYSIFYQTILATKRSLLFGPLTPETGSPEQLQTLKNLILEKTTLMTPYQDFAKKRQFASTVVQTIKSGFLNQFFTGKGIDDPTKFKVILECVRDEEVFNLIKIEITTDYNEQQGSYWTSGVNWFKGTSEQVKTRKQIIDQIHRSMREEKKFVGFELPAEAAPIETAVPRSVQVQKPSEQPEGGLGTEYALLLRSNVQSRFAPKDISEQTIFSREVPKVERRMSGHKEMARPMREEPRRATLETAPLPSSAPRIAAPPAFQRDIRRKQALAHVMPAERDKPKIIPFGARKVLPDRPS